MSEVLTIRMRGLLIGMVYAAIVAGCSPHPQSQTDEFRRLATVEQYASVGTVSRAIVTAEPQWTSDEFFPISSQVIKGFYGVAVSDDVQNPKNPEILRKPISEPLQPADRGSSKKIERMLLPLGTTDVGQSQQSGKFKFTVSLESDGNSEITVMSDIIDLDASTEKARWKDFSYVISESYEKPARLRCSWRRISGESGRGVFSVPVIVGHDSRSESQQGVILISFDTLRADHLGCYGYPRALSPNIDRLAERGLLFSEIRSTSAWTLPAHVSLLTGQGPTRHGVNLPQSGSFATDFRSLPELLVNHGWRTAAFTGGAYVSAKWGLERGFEVFDYTTGSARDSFLRAERWLRENPAGNFFLFIHHYDAHIPYNIHNPHPIFSIPGLDSNKVSHNGSPLPVEDLVGMYDDAIRNADKEFGRFMISLDKLGLQNRTTVILTSDHGEEFSDHGRFLHNLTLYEEILRVPLIVRSLDSPAPRIVSEAGALTDIVSTVCSLAGLAGSYDGKDLTGLGREPVGSESGDEGHSDRDVSETRTHNLTMSIIDGNWKFILSDEFGLKRYDLSRDPAERNPESAAGFWDVPCRIFVTELSREAAGKAQLWIFNARGEVSGAIGYDSEKIEIQPIMAGGLQTSEESDSSMAFTFNATLDSPFCGLTFSGEGFRLHRLTVEGVSKAPSAIKIGYALKAVEPNEDGIRFPPPEPAPSDAEWLRGVCKDDSTGVIAVMVNPQAKMQVAPANETDEVLEEQLRTLGYLE